MPTNNSLNNEFANNADGWSLWGGITRRLLKILGADIEITGTGTNVYTFPSATSTLSRTTTIFNRQTASYTLVLTDKDDTTVEMNVASANNLTVPTNASVAFPIGTRIKIAQYGAGQTSIVASGGVTLRSSGNKLKVAAQYDVVTLEKVGADEWYLYGNLTV